MGAGTITAEYVEDFPKTERVGAPSGPRETDVDIALRDFQAKIEAGDVPAEAVLKFLDYNVENELDDAGVVIGTRPVDASLARQRAGGRVPTLKARGYSEDDGWVIKSRNGCVFAKWYGPGNVPASEKAQGKPVGEDVPV